MYEYFVPRYHLVGAVSYNRVGHCVDSVHALPCSAVVRIIYQKPSPFRTAVRWNTFKLCPESFPPSNSICMGKYFFPEYKHPFWFKDFHTSENLSISQLWKDYFLPFCLSSELSLVVLTLIHRSVALFDKDIKFDSVKA